jgi:phospholipid/cholesterol/gamma-HCH transport system substrate-binding protein
VSLLGEGAVDITLSPRGTPIPAGGYVATGKPAAALSDVTSQASEGIAELTGLIQDVRGGRGSLGKLATDPALFNELNRFAATAADVTKTIRDGRGTMGRLINDPNAMRSEASSKPRRDDAADQRRRRQHRQAAERRDLRGRRPARRQTFVTLTERLNWGEGTAGVVHRSRAFNQLKSLADRLDDLTKRLNSGEDLRSVAER